MRWITILRGTLISLFGVSAAAQILPRNLTPPPLNVTPAPQKPSCPVGLYKGDFLVNFIALQGRYCVASEMQQISGIGVPNGPRLSCPIHAYVANIVGDFLCEQYPAEAKQTLDAQQKLSKSLDETNAQLDATRTQLEELQKKWIAAGGK